MSETHEIKELKAFVRTDRVDQVVRALEAAGAPGITVSHVHGVGYGYEPFLFTLTPSEMAKIPRVAKVEVVCTKEMVGKLRQAVIDAGRTGAPGDGIIFVTPVEVATKIRTGEVGAEAL